MSRDDLIAALSEAREVLREIAVDVVLADDLAVEAQRSALWTVVRHHTAIAKTALGDYCDKCGAHVGEWESKPCVSSLTRASRHTITRVRDGR